MRNVWGLGVPLFRVYRHPIEIHRVSGLWDLKSMSKHAQANGSGRQKVKWKQSVFGGLHRGCNVGA